MKINDRVLAVAHFTIYTGATVRETAEKFGISKSAVHQDLKVRLPQINIAVYNKVLAVLNRNKDERHLRGGEATKRRFAPTLLMEQRG